MEILEQLKAIIENEVLNESSKDFICVKYLNSKKKINKNYKLVERMEQAGLR